MHWNQYFSQNNFSSAYCIIGDIEHYSESLLEYFATTYPEYTREVFTFEIMKVEDAAMIRHAHTEHAQTILILDIHFATRETQNALLKFIEEPPAGTHIILCVPHHTTLLDTLYSRCVCIDMRGEWSNGSTHEKDHNKLPHPKEFLALSYQERLELIKQLTKKVTNSTDTDNEDLDLASQQDEEENDKEEMELTHEKKLTHNDVQKFITELERYFYTHKKLLRSQEQYIQINETLETMKSYLASPSSSIAMILEMIALELPVV